MRINTVELTNFRSYDRKVFDFSSKRVIGIVGKTGSGKSTIIEAIRYALFGKFREKSEDSVVREGCGEAVVVINFDHNGRKYEISRTKRVGHTASTIFTADGALVNVAGGARAVNKAIIDEIGFNDDMFTAISFFIQKQGHEFVEAAPGGRRQYLAGILNCQGLPQAADAARQRAREAGVLHNQKVGALAAYKERYQEYDQKSLEEDMFSFASKSESLCSQIAANESAIESLVSEVAQIQAAINNLNKLADKKLSLSRSIDVTKRLIVNVESAVESHISKRDDEQRQIDDWVSEMDSDLSNLPKIPDDVDEVNESLREVSGRLNSIIAKVGIFKARKLAGRSSAGCDACGQEISDEYVENFIKHLTDEFDKLNARKLELLQKKNQYDDILRQHADYDARYRGKVLQLSMNYEVAIAACREQLEAYRQRLEAQTNELNETQSEIDSIELVDISEKKSALQSLRNETRNFRLERSDLERSIEQIRGLLVAINDNNRLIERTESELKELWEESNAIKKVVDAFAVKIPAMIVENALGCVTTYANELLNEFGLGFRISIVTQAENKSGNVVETIDIIIEKPDGTRREYESFSGGQKDIINFSIRLALARMMSLNTGTTIRSIFMDEVFSGLDDGSVQVMLKVIAVLQDMFDQIFMVTHMENIKDSIPDVFRVGIENGVSFV